MVNIVPYTPQLNNAFAKLWVPWLKQITGTEPEESDLSAVVNPKQYYIENGGAVFFALSDANPVGVVAVKKLTNTTYEFCKLVVMENARGQGLGRLLVEKCIEFVKLQQGKALYLQSFNKLEVAVSMYKKMGFISCQAPEGMLVVKRTEIIMKMDL
jgi:GNAT superfamily N-acetyltransferase